MNTTNERDLRHHSNTMWIPIPFGDNYVTGLDAAIRGVTISDFIAWMATEVMANQECNLT